jgi:hypothetical protein
MQPLVRTHGPIVAALVVGAAILSQPVAGQAQTTFPDVCKIRFDQRAAAELLARTDGRARLSDLLREAASVEVHSEAEMRFVLHIYEMRGARVVRRFQSSPFTGPAGARVALGRVLGVGEPGFGSFRFDPSHLLEAVKPVPADAAIDDPGRFVIDGIIPYHPKLWETMSTFYLVAVPADRREAARATVGIGVVFGASSR